MFNRVEYRMILLPVDNAENHNLTALVCTTIKGSKSLVLWEISFLINC
jgi:hypothetical protein